MQSEDVGPRDGFRDLHGLAPGFAHGVGGGEGVGDEDAEAQRATTASDHRSDASEAEHRHRGGRGAHGERSCVDGLPGPGTHGAVVGGQASRLGHDHGDGVRCHLFDAVARGVRDGDATNGRSLDIDHVVPDADTADDAEVRHPVHHITRDLRPLHDQPFGVGTEGGDVVRAS